MPSRIDATDIANAGSFLSRELEQNIDKVYMKKYAKLWAEEGTHLPAIPDLDEGTTVITADIVEAVGEAAELSDLTDDVPTVEVSEDEDRFAVHCFVAGYKYTIPQLKAAEKAGKNIDMRRVTAVDRALRQRVHNAAVFGVPKRNTTGLFNNPNVPIYATGYDANTASWQDGIDFAWGIVTTIEDLNYLVSSITKIIVPNKLYKNWHTTYQTNDSGKTIAEAIQTKANLEIVAENECRADLLERFGVRPAGTNEDRLVFMSEDQDVVERSYYPPNYLPPQLKDMSYKVCAYTGTSETRVHYPEAMGYADIPKVV